MLSDFFVPTRAQSRNNLEISSHILACSYSGENRNMFGEAPHTHLGIDFYIRGFAQGDLGGRKTGYFQLT